MQKFANLVDLEKCRKMRIWLQKLALIQPRTGFLKFAKNLPKICQKLEKLEKFGKNIGDGAGVVSNQGL